MAKAWTPPEETTPPLRREPSAEQLAQAEERRRAKWKTLHGDDQPYPGDETSTYEHSLGLSRNLS